MVTSFSFARIPEIYFGVGKFEMLPKLIKQYGIKVLLVTGKTSFIESEKGRQILKKLNQENISFELVHVHTEPSVTFIDEVCQSFRKSEINVVVAIGGGSVIDAGKAISAMIPLNDSVKPYLEGVVSGKTHSGVKLPFIAIPTTSGTGSEATKNAVISEVGEKGFKKSLRHNNFVPDIALVDPELTLHCPPEITAFTGLDAITQLLEAYVSIQASEFTDAIAFSGLQHAAASIQMAYHNGINLEARSNMSYAALLSGIVLANAGLGTVHGFASAIGGFFDVPHGAICGTLLGVVNRKNIEKLILNNDKLMLAKYAKVGRLFCNEMGKTDEFYIHSFADKLDCLINEFKVPKFNMFGILQSDVNRILDQTSNKNNPVNFNSNELEEILISRI